MSPPRILARRILSDAFFRLEQVSVEQERHDGTRQVIEREVYHNGPGAAVLPVDRARGTILLVRQMRVPALVNGDAPFLLEACAGIVDAGDTPETTARKEAEQELGVRIRDLVPLGSVYPSPGASAETVALFLASYGQADRTGGGGGLRAEGEEIGVVEMTLAEADALVRQGGIRDAKTIILLAAILRAAIGRG